MAVEFPPNGSFVRVKVKERDYWYFQEGARDNSGHQRRRYVGADTSELRERIRRHGETKNDYRERRRLVAMLRRAGFAPAQEDTGRILKALAEAGTFRRRACLVGTAAFQIYGPLLGVQMQEATLRTSDLDIAQFRAVSLAIAADEQTPPMLTILQEIDSSFRAVPHHRNANTTTTYINRNGLRVEILTDSRGPERDEPTRLPAIGSDAQPLRFMDFLIRDEIQAAVLYEAGILVNVPAPERYALHKLIVAQRRRTGAAKSEKDLLQAAALIVILSERRSTQLREMWTEAYGRGPRWQELLIRGLGMIAPHARDRMLYVIGSTRRNLFPDADVHFRDETLHYVFSRDVVQFVGVSGGEHVSCAISREALEDHFGADGLTQVQRTALVSRNRAEIEPMARIIYLDWPVPEDGSVLIRTADVVELRRLIRQKQARKTRAKR